MSVRKRVILLLVTLALLTVSYAYAERKTVKAGFFAFPGYHQWDESTGRTGYGADFLQFVRRYADLDFDYVGYDAERASDGVQCVSKMEKADDQYYDLIWMDIQMPNMNGYDATRVIRDLKDPKKRTIPIVAMTANAFDEDKKRAFASGMDGFIAKPVDISQLVATLDDLLGKQ